MDENVKVIFEGIKNALGESSSVITDRTIEQTINEFSAFAPQENAEKLHPAVFCGIVCLLSKTSKVVL